MQKEGSPGLGREAMNQSERWGEGSLLGKR